jgi:quinol monooxygenase YgiN
MMLGPAEPVPPGNVLDLVYVPPGSAHAQTEETPTVIIVLAKVESSAPEIESLRTVLVEMQAASRAESGCHDYTFSQEIADPNRIRIVELWESIGALRAHFGTPHMAKFREALAAPPPRSMELKLHELGQALEMPS